MEALRVALCACALLLSNAWCSQVRLSLCLSSTTCTSSSIGSTPVWVEGMACERSADEGE
eukprot:10443694-Alexandrium_andersonii.AAC.1